MWGAGLHMRLHEARTHLRNRGNFRIHFNTFSKDFIKFETNIIFLTTECLKFLLDFQVT